MINEKGNIQIDQVNMFPVIKKWLYADKDIFIREVVSNGMDAITKLINISNGGQYTLPENTKWRVDVKVDEKNKTLTFIDNGIGMTENEVKKYINQVAFSGAKEFAEKYKEYVDKNATDEIIGHFGLGFYSTFMVSTKVEIDTLSFMEGAKAVKWVSESGMDYEMSDSDKTERGTTITLHIAPDSEEFLNAFKVKEIVRKYCYFLPHEIYVTDVNEKHECTCEHSEDDHECECHHEDGECECHHDDHECECHKETPVNDTHPLWTKSPNECTDEEYKEFYKRVFNDYNEPLFWIHLNVDYPFRLKGILYFPQVPDKFQPFEGMVKLYSNQVFIADNVKEVIPEFLMLLKGCLDCQDLPLNVSRSFLQNDGYVSKISKHITKKIAEKLKSLFNNNRDDYNKYWDDINLFIKYGCLKDDKFYDMMKDYLVFKTINGEYKVLNDLIDENAEKNTVFYVTDKNQQSQLISMFKENEQEAVYLDTLIDRNFINYLESKNEKLSFVRIDSDIASSLKSDGVVDTKLGEEAVELFKKALNREDIEVTAEAMKNDKMPAIIFLSEESRRIREMYEHYKLSGMAGELDIDKMFPMKYKVVLNSNNDLIAKLVEKSADEETVNLLAAQVFDMALMNLRALTPEETAEFTKRSIEIMNRII